MNPKKVSDRTATSITMLLVAIFVVLIGLYTDNSGFMFAGVIFSVVGLVMVLNRNKENDS